jgi:threonine aldolase
MLGKPAALFVPSGTMGNLCGILALTASHAGPGEVILGDESHIFHYERGGLAAVGGLTSHAIATAEDGSLPLDRVEAAVRPEDVHHAPTRAVSIENTHNRMGGRALPSAYLQELAALCKQYGVPLHMDGARLFNAAASLGVDVAELATHATTVSICLSKGLGAPVGSVLAGDEAVIHKARGFRKMLGGGMRQAGVIAGCGLVALRKNSSAEALLRDHRQATAIAAAINSNPKSGLHVDHVVETNIVYATVSSSQSASAVADQLLSECNTKAGPYGDNRLRFVTHRQVRDTDIDQLCKWLGRLGC